MASAIELLLLAASSPLLREGSSGIWDLAWCQSDTGTYANSNNGTQPLTASWSIPAGDAAAGSVYEIEVPFNGTFETQTLGFKPYLNGSAPATSGGDTIGGAFFTSGQGFAGTVKLRMQVITAGASGTVNFFVTGGLGVNAARSSGSNTNDAFLSSQATGAAFNTTVANTIAVASAWGGSASGQAVTGRGSTLTRKGP